MGILSNTTNNAGNMAVSTSQKHQPASGSVALPQGNDLARLSLDPLRAYASLSVEEILYKLCSAGNPVIRKMDGGWMCGVDMHVAAAGTTFNVRSEFDCKTQLDAARQCAERVLKTLSQWS